MTEPHEAACPHCGQPVAHDVRGWAIVCPHCSGDILIRQHEYQPEAGDPVLDSWLEPG